MSNGKDIGSSRRKFLTHLGGGTIAAAVGIGLVPDPPTSPATEPAHGDVTPERKSIPESSTPYAVWQYRRDSDEFTSTAPVNVVFPLEDATFSEVTDVFEAADWYSYPEEYARYAWDRATEEYRLQQYTAAETYFGQVGRHHVRCWETDGTASIQAHVDTAAVPNHGIASYVEGQRGVEMLFREAGWHVEQDALDFENDRNPDHDGQISVIRAEER